MEQEEVDKSKVTLRVPRRLLARHRGDEYVEWREFKLKTRLLPNGYRVTLAVVDTDQYLYFGASACSPYDPFDRKSAYPRALGRARQLAFRCKFGAPAMGVSLLSEREGEIGGVFYTSIGTTMIEKRAVIRERAEGLYAIAASNAEEKAVLVEISEIEHRHGGRFAIWTDKK